MRITYNIIILNCIGIFPSKIFLRVSKFSNSLAVREAFSVHTFVYSKGYLSQNGYKVRIIAQYKIVTRCCMKFLSGTY